MLKTTVFLLLLTLSAKAIDLSLVVKADGYTAVDGSISNGSNIFNSNSRACTSVDVGKILVVERGPQSGNTIASCSGPSYVFTGSPSSVTDSGLSWGIGTNNSSILQSAVNTYPRSELKLPAGQILLGNSSTNLTDIKICGQGVPQNRTAAAGSSAKSGTTIIVTNYSAPTFVIHQSVELCGMNYFWPVNGGKVSAPVATPPLLTDTGSDQLSDFTFRDSAAINPYVLFKQDPANVVLGGVRFIDNNVYAISEAFELSNVGETFSISGGIYNPSVYAAVNLAGPTPALGVWSANNASFLKIRGNGDAGACSTLIAGGIKVTNHTTIVGYNLVVYVNGGAWDESVFDDSVDVNGNVNILLADANSTITRTRMNGQYYPNGIFGVTSTGSHFFFDSTCTGSLAPSDFSFTGNISGATGTVFDIEGTNLKYFSLNNSIIQNYANTTPAPHPFYMLYANNPNLVLMGIGNQSNPNYSGASYHGVQVDSAAVNSFPGAPYNNIGN